MTKIIINFEYDEPILTSNTADKKRRNELFKALVKGLKFFLVSDCMEYDDADNNIKFLWKGDDVIFVKGCTCVDCEEAEEFLKSHKKLLKEEDENEQSKT